MCYDYPGQLATVEGREIHISRRSDPSRHHRLSTFLKTPRLHVVFTEKHFRRVTPQHIYLPPVRIIFAGLHSGEMLIRDSGYMASL